MRTTRSALLALSIALVAGLATACATSVPSDPPGITGTISSVGQASDATTVLVTGTGQVDKASVLIDARTTLLRETPDGISALLLADLKQGARVSVWFDGPVAESYPVQAHAGTVLLLVPSAP